MPKPFSLQAPEDIAKEYGGNKQRIAQAMQMGVVDPTAGTLAGMFIDRMRSAQMQEAAPAPTVAQQVFAPPAPPAPPMSAPPPGGAPPMGAPPMGAPPMGGMPPGGPPMGAPPAPPMGGMPPGAPPMGMADGGLAALPVPDNMFDEPMDGEYAGGGIVAFATGDEVDYNDILQKQMAYFNDPEKLKADYFMGGQPKREAAERLRQFYEGALSEEGLKKRRDEDKYLALAQLGATMASTPGSLLQAFGAGVGKALPGLQESSRERRAEQRDAIKQLALDEGATNAEARDIGKLVMDGRLKATDIGQTIAQIRSRETLGREDIQSRERISAADNDARIRAALLEAGAGGKDGMRPTYSASVELSGKQKTDVDDALKEMIKAEEKGDYTRFKAAGSKYSTALRNYNQTIVNKLGYNPEPSVPMGLFPKMGELAKKDTSIGHGRVYGGKKPALGSKVMNAADEILARTGVD